MFVADATENSDSIKSLRHTTDCVLTVEPLPSPIIDASRKRSLHGDCEVKPKHLKVLPDSDAVAMVMARCSSGSPSSDNQCIEILSLSRSSNLFCLLCQLMIIQVITLVVKW